MSLSILTHAHDLPAQNYFVILAGGSGERLWPLSRKGRPKQLLPLGDERTLLEQAVDRVAPLTTTKDQLLVLTTKNHEQETRLCVGDKAGMFLTEPAARNTGPAIIYACLELHRMNPDAVVVFLPADPFIPLRDQEQFLEAISHAVYVARERDVIALVGIKPTFPAVGYGYIQYCMSMKDDGVAAFKIESFHEKPSLETAFSYLNKDNMLWNIGIFAGKVSVFLDECARIAPDLWRDMIAFEQGKLPYDQIASLSIDYAIMEKSDRLWVIPALFSWCDVGTVGAFLSIKKEHDIVPANVISVDSHNNLVDVPDRLTALVGVDDLCIVQTNDVLLITKQEQAEKVRSVVTQLRNAGLDAYL